MLVALALALAVLAWVLIALVTWWAWPERPPPDTPVTFYAPPSPEPLSMFQIKATDSPRTLRVAFADAEGNPAPVEGAPQWSVSDPSVGDITPSADGYACEFNPGAPSSGQINVVADADLGEGFVHVGGTLDVVVVPGDAVVAVISVDPAA